ncbi:MAG: diphthine--ammonia ligase [Candidatus Bathyarchaeota archaeon]|nr:diphthine--ammonia ligase [Candidatus Bathyarchaeota archaeon]
MTNLSENIVVSWSGGKDSAMALYEVLKDSGIRVLALLGTFRQDDDRINIHGVRRVLVEQQAKALGLPLEKMLVRKGASDREYEKELLGILQKYKAQSVDKVLFGDIFLEDIRRFREESLHKVGMQGVFPLWKKDTGELARAFIEAGFKAVVTAVDSNVLGEEFVGKDFDEEFLEALPFGVDPCGENGEFHSFVYDGPIFKKAVEFTLAERVLRDNRFWNCDLMPLDNQGV